MMLRCSCPHGLHLQLGGAQVGQHSCQLRQSQEAAVLSWALVTAACVGWPGLAWQLALPCSVAVLLSLLVVCLKG
jgi:hypothetical protein